MELVINQGNFLAERPNSLSNQNKYYQEILPFIPQPLKQYLADLPTTITSGLEEIRFRAGKPLFIRANDEEYFLTASGPAKTQNAKEPLLAEEILIKKILHLISSNSIYALEEELRNGYLTLKGGHRVGFAGEAILENGRIKTLKNISSLNFRITREVFGLADELMPYLVDTVTLRPHHTLIVSPPRCGKTTLLRDITRKLSDGIPELNFPGLNVGLVDERSELAGCFHGVPQNDIGLRTDILDACPKAQGMMMFLRSMSPQVIAADELGRPEDVEAVLEVLNAGVTVISTVHGHDLEEIVQRPIISRLLSQKVFQRIIILSRRRGPGTVEQILDGTSGVNLFNNYLTKNKR